MKFIDPIFPNPDKIIESDPKNITQPKMAKQRAIRRDKTHDIN